MDGSENTHTKHPGWSNQKDTGKGMRYAAQKVSFPPLESLVIAEHVQL